MINIKKNKSESSFKKLKNILSSTPKSELKHIAEYLVCLYLNRQIKNIFEYILNNGFDINETYENGSTLIFNSSYMDLDFIKYIIEKGVNINHLNSLNLIVLSRYSDMELEKIDFFINQGIKIQDEFLKKAFFTNLYVNKKETKLNIKTILLLLEKNPEIYSKIKDKISYEIDEKIPLNIKDASNLGLI